MRIHLIRSAEVSPEFYDNVLDLVNSIPGPVEFQKHDAPVEFNENEVTVRPFIYSKFKVQRADYSLLYLESARIYDQKWPPPFPEEISIVSWETLFNKCDSFRTANSLPADDHVILLTDHVNNKNWFTASDKSGALNHFVHSGQWEFFLPCDPKFPVAYEVIGAFIRRLMFDNYEELQRHVHKTPLGCLNDYCLNKREITFKLRTGDICPNCMKLISQRGVDPRIMQQVFNIIDSIRTQMLFRERFRIAQRPSRIAIVGNTKKILFTDLANTELRLTPLERTLYLLFLKEEGGLQLHELPEHENWIRETYRQIGNPQTVAALNNSIASLVNPMENSAMEKISKIKSKVMDVTGEELAVYYIIDGPRGEKKKIALDRSLVTGNYS